MYERTTHAIRVSVEPFYLERESEPDKGQYFWAYRIRICNQGATTVQLKNRYWRITDSRGRQQEVHGVGVVGEQPVLKPGETYEYASGTPLPTPSGVMVGHYRMVAADGEDFDVEIPAFSLDSPHEKAPMN